MATCGLRIGEAVGLQVGDLDVADCQLHIRRTVRRGYIDSPKNGEAEIVDVPPTTMADVMDAILTGHPRNQAQPPRNQLRDLTAQVRITAHSPLQYCQGETPPDPALALMDRPGAAKAVGRSRFS